METHIVDTTPCPHKHVDAKHEGEKGRYQEGAIHIQEGVPSRNLRPGVVMEACTRSDDEWEVRYDLEYDALCTIPETITGTARPRKSPVRKVLK